MGHGILRWIGDETRLHILVAGSLAIPAMLVILYSFRVFMNSKDRKFRRWQGAWLLGVLSDICGITVLP